ncbi:MAG: B12-binding domain-containing radical SAM protein [Actinomycetia bacterium]|nr:B12-binding domain-containing radical SAM protein [Actinomycetes bacterium]
MRVLLFNAPVARLSIHAQVSPPLGLAYLASFLREHGHEVEVVDLNLSASSLQRAEVVLKRFQPDLVGMSVHTETYNNAVRYALRIKEWAPGVPIVFGGAHPSILPADVLQESCVDFVIVGEGERPLLSLVSALESGADGFASIPGLGYAVDGVPQINARGATGDPDAYPYPAWDLLSFDFYENPFTVLTARGGCPYRCPFCSASFIWSGRHRQRSAVSVVDELAYLMREYGATHVFFGDDIFTLSRRWVREFLREMKRVAGQVTWACATRADLVDQQMLSDMAHAGCTGIQFGIESGSQAILDSVKGITKDAARRAVEWSVAAGIQPTVSFMVPLPDDTPETLDETFDFVAELKSAGADPSISYTAPFPGTLFYEKAEELGITVLSREWEEYDCKHAIIETTHLSAAQVEEITEKRAQALGIDKNV